MFSIFKKKEVKLCRDCKWHEEEICKNPKITTIDTNLVTGERTLSYLSCEWRRYMSSFGKCGTKGKYWEAKE